MNNHKIKDVSDLLKKYDFICGIEMDKTRPLQDKSTAKITVDLNNANKEELKEFNKECIILSNNLRNQAFCITVNYIIHE